VGLHRRELALTSVVRRVRGPGGVPGTAPKPSSGPDAAHTILTVTNDGSGNAVFTTAAPHGLVANVDFVDINGTSSSTYNAQNSMLVDDTPTPTTFVQFSGYLEDATGGSWTLL
jgi:hypothetical protein